MFDDNLNMRGRIEQFDLKHGSDAIRIDNWLVYSDGAMREVNPHGSLHEPPGNVHERCKIKVRYREELLQRAVNEFHDAKDQLLATAKARLRNGDPCESRTEAVAKLTELQTVVKERQRQLNIARTKLEASTPVGLRANTQVSAENKQKNETFISAISQIKI